MDDRFPALESSNVLKDTACSVVFPPRRARELVVAQGPGGPCAFLLFPKRPILFAPAVQLGVKIGHICLAPPHSEASERFASLVEAIARHDVEQHVLVASVALARRLATCKRVSVGPIVKTPVMAYCLMPNVEVAHVHESKSGQAGLLLTLTRSIPFIITTTNGESDNPLTRSVLQRAAQTLNYPASEPGNQSARKLLSIYEDALSRIPREFQPPA